MQSFTVVIVGDSGVGKSSLILRFIHNSFSNQVKPSLGIEKFQKAINVSDQEQITIQLFDTAGQEKYKSIAEPVYKLANGIIFAYSIADKQSLKNIENWIKQVEKCSSQPIIKILVGNQVDKTEGERKVTQEEGEQFKTQNNLNYFIETSAVTGNNVDKLFEECGKLLLSNKTIQLQQSKEMTNQTQTQKLIPEHIDPDLRLDQTRYTCY